jgi:hypothetical protein
VSRVSKIILVHEGWRDSAFARGFLGAAGVDGRAIDPRPNPGGSGHDWVKNQFAAEVANLMRFSEGRGVIGLLDEDGRGVADRERELEELLKGRSLPPISAQEGRCLLLPTRNLETWLYWLTAQRRGSAVAVDETTDYKRGGPPADVPRIQNADCRPAGEALHGLNHAQPPQGCPPMLIRALGHLREFLNAVRL